MVNITPPVSPIAPRRRKAVSTQQQQSQHHQCWLSLSFAVFFVVVMILSWSGFTSIADIDSSAVLVRRILKTTMGTSSLFTSASSAAAGTAPASSPSSTSHHLSHDEKKKKEQQQSPPLSPPRDPYTLEGRGKDGQQREKEAKEDEEEEETTTFWSKATKAQLEQKQKGNKTDNEDTEDEDEDDGEEEEDDDKPPYGERRMPPFQEHFPGKKKAQPYNPDTEDPIDKCRRDPTWRRAAASGDIYDDCKRLMQWEPRDTWWRLDPSYNNFTLNGHVDDMHRCIARKFDTAFQRNQHPPWTQCNERARNISCHVPPTEVMGYYRSPAEGEAVLFRNAMTEQEVFGLRSLQACMQKYLPQDNPWWEYREFGYDAENDVIGGNEVTFVQGMIQIFVPGIAATLYRNFRMAYEEGNWAKHGFLNLGYPPPNSLGIRTAEALEYRDAGRLGTHADSESIFTIAIALSEETSYQGGHFRLDSEHALFKVPRLGALSFFAESFHGVTKVTGGDRSIFVVEIWESDDAPPGVPRCDPQVWFEHMQDRWPVITGAAKEYLWDKKEGEEEEEKEEGEKKKERGNVVEEQ
jgi:hypothetical protein